MITGENIGEVISGSGMPRGKTRTAHVRSSLKKHGLDLLDGSRKRPEDFSICMCRVHWPGCKVTHWVILDKIGNIFDSIYGVNPLWPDGSRITTYYKVIKTRCGEL
jgi:hypothetical protein